MASFTPSRNVESPGAFALPTKCACFAAKTAKGALEKGEIVRRSLGSGDVAIQIKYVGICHSDIHQTRGEWDPSAMFPMVPGHEIVGVVVATGLLQNKFRPGDVVGVGPMVDSCRSCEHCKSGLEQYCADQGTVFTYNSKFMHAHCAEHGARTYGGFSESIVVDQHYVVNIPEGMDLASAAPLLCAGISTYSPLMRFGLIANKRLGVVGIGGLGHIAVKLGRALGCHVTAVSRGMKKRSSVLEHLGAHEFIDSTDAEAMRKAQASIDFILDTIPAVHDLGTFLELLRVDGKYIVVGLPPEKLQLQASSIVQDRKILAGSKIGGMHEMQEMLDFCCRHKISSDVEVVPAASINECFDRVVTSSVRYRYVVDVSTIAS